MISFFVYGIPKSMSVGKSVRVKNATGGRSFQTREHTEWATLVGHVGRIHRPLAPIEGPIVLEATFYMPRPTSAARRVLYPVRRPDLDNCFHKLSDQWNGVFWVDDSQIVDVLIRKRFPRADGCVGADFVIRRPTVEEMAYEARLQGRPAQPSLALPGTPRTSEP